MNPLFGTPDERSQARVIVAGVALHALLSSTAPTHPAATPRVLVDKAFEIAGEFLIRAEQELGR